MVIISNASLGFVLILFAGGNAIFIPLPDLSTSLKTYKKHKLQCCMRQSVLVHCITERVHCIDSVNLLLDVSGLFFGGELSLATTSNNLLVRVLMDGDR